MLGEGIGLGRDVGERGPFGGEIVDRGGERPDQDAEPAAPGTAPRRTRATSRRSARAAIRPIELMRAR